MLKTLKVILSDLDGVLRYFPEQREREIEQKYQVPLGTTQKHAFESSLLKKAITGTISDGEWRVAMQESLSKEISESLAASLVQEWSNFPGVINKEIYSYFMFLKAKYKFGLLTNATSRLNSDLKTLGVFESFDFIFNSSELGLAKPEPELFHKVSEILKIKPSEILFIDDKESFTSAAKECGYQVHHFMAFDELKKNVK